jgi:hypothetical protein
VTEPEQGEGVHRSMRRLNPTLLVLLAGVVILVLLLIYVASTKNPNEDKLNDSEISQPKTTAASAERRCASQATYDLLKRELFRRAAQMRASDAGAYDRLSAYAVVRMENPVVESENRDTGAVNCSGSLSLDLPPGVAVVGGRRTLTSDVDYTLQPAADGSGSVVLLRNSDAIIAPLATLARTAGPQQPATAATETNEAAPAVTGPVQPGAQPPEAPAAPETPRPAATRPSFDCGSARTRGEIAVCSDAGLAALDRNMDAQYGRAVSVASPEQRDLLKSTARRFYAFRDRCTDNRCIGDAYVGRMREIRDIMEGRWQPAR